MSHRNTTTRAIRIPDEVWSAAETRAAEQGINVSEFVRRAVAKAAGVKVSVSPTTLKPGPKPTR